MLSTLPHARPPTLINPSLRMLVICKRTNRTNITYTFFSKCSTQNGTDNIFVRHNGRACYNDHDARRKIHLYLHHGAQQCKNYEAPLRRWTIIIKFYTVESTQNVQNYVRFAHVRETFSILGYGCSGECSSHELNKSLTSSRTLKPFGRSGFMRFAVGWNARHLTIYIYVETTRINAHIFLLFWLKTRTGSEHNYHKDVVHSTLSTLISTLKPHCSLE